MLLSARDATLAALLNRDANSNLRAHLSFISFNRIEVSVFMVLIQTFCLSQIRVISFVNTYNILTSYVTLLVSHATLKINAGFFFNYNVGIIRTKSLKTASDTTKLVLRWSELNKMQSRLSESRLFEILLHLELVRCSRGRFYAGYEFSLCA